MAITSACVVTLGTQRQVSAALHQLSRAGFDPSQVTVVARGAVAPVGSLEASLRGLPEVVAADYQSALRRGGYLVMVRAALDALGGAERALTDLGHEVDWHSLPAPQPEAMPRREAPRLRSPRPAARS